MVTGIWRELAHTLLELALVTLWATVMLFSVIYHMWQLIVTGRLAK